MSRPPARHAVRVLLHRNTATSCLYANSELRRNHLTDAEHIWVGSRLRHVRLIKSSKACELFHWYARRTPLVNGRRLVGVAERQSAEQDQIGRCSEKRVDRLVPVGPCL